MQRLGLLVLSIFVAFFIALVPLWLIFTRFVELPSYPPVPDIVERVEIIQSALNDLETLSIEVERLAQQAIDAERRAAEAAELANLSAEEIQALENRLNDPNREAQNMVIGAAVGALFGVLADQLVILLHKRWIKKASTTPHLGSNVP
jgi:hypothetical protein